MAQRPTVRTDSTEQRGNDDKTPPLDAMQSKQCNNPAFEPLSIRVSGSAGGLSSSGPELDQVLNLIAEQACLATSATASAIALKQDDEIICRATAGPNAPDLGVSLNASSGLSGACVRTRDAQYCEDTEADPRVNPETCRRLDVRSLLVVPLLKDDELFGIFEIFSPVPRAFARHDLQNLQALASVILDAVQPSIDDPTVITADDEPLFTLADISGPAEAPVPHVEALEAEAPIAEEGLLAGEVSSEEEVAKEKEEEEAPVFPVESAIDWVDALAARVDATVPRTEVPIVPAPAIPPAESHVLHVPPPPASIEFPVPMVAAPARQAETFAPKEKIRSAPVDTPILPPDFLPTLSDPNLQRRDWMSTGLTVAVIALALVLGWMLGRVGWERAMGGRKSQANLSASSASPSAPQQRASPSNSLVEVEPVLVEPAERSSAVNRAPRQTLTQPKSAASTGSDGGLVVYEGGKIIFQQNSVAGSGRSIASSIAGSSDASLSPRNPSEAPPIAVSSQVASAHLVQRIEPIYPEEARERSIQGEVVLDAVVAKDGSVKELRLISGDTQLAAAASAAVQQWRFRPYEQHGKPADFSTRLTVNFRLH